MTVTTDTPAQTPTATHTVELVGRPTFVENGRVLTTVLFVSGNLIYTVHQPDRGLADAEVVTLPIMGEFVTISEGSQTITGHWLGLAAEKPLAASTVDAFVLTTVGIVQTVTVPHQQVEARNVVTPRDAEMHRDVAMTALLVEATKSRKAEIVYKRRMDALVEDAHSYASNNDLCSTFDDFMEEHDLPRRITEYELAVEVTATVYVSREGADLDDAISKVDADDIAHLLDEDNIRMHIRQD